MSTINTGNQEIWLHYKNLAKTSEVGKLNYGILKPGIYSGGELSTSSGTYMNIAAFNSAISTTSGQVLRIKTSSSVPLLVNAATPFLTANFQWINSESNYLNWTAKASGDLDQYDLIFGKGIFDSSGNLINFSYENKTRGLIDESNNIHVEEQLLFGHEADANLFRSNTNELTTSGTLIAIEEIKTDTITERTPGAGVTINGLVINNGEIDPLYTNTINEKDVGSGVTIEQVEISSGNVVIPGNLTVNGTQSFMNVTDLEIKDPVILLNKGETGGGITSGSGGIKIDRGVYSYVDLTYSEGDTSWGATFDGGSTRKRIVNSNGQLISDATSSAPIITNSSTLVTNLNADLLDGYHASDFVSDYRELEIGSGGLIRYQNVSQYYQETQSSGNIIIYFPYPPDNSYFEIEMQGNSSQNDGGWQLFLTGHQTSGVVGGWENCTALSLGESPFTYAKFGTVDSTSGCMLILGSDISSGTLIPNNTNIELKNIYIKNPLGKDWDLYYSMLFFEDSTSGVTVAVNKQITASGSGGGLSLPNTVSVDPLEAEIAGKRYQTIANALVYIATQTPSSTNRWTVLVGGLNNESFSTPDYVTIQGFNNAVLTGAIDGSASVPDFSLSNQCIKDCTLTNLSLTGSNFITLINSTVANSNNSGGILIGHKIIILDGNYSSTMCLLYDSLTTDLFSGGNIVIGESSSIFQNCDMAGVDLTNGGKYINCSLNFASISAGTYTFRGGYFAGSAITFVTGVDISAYNFDFNNVPVDIADGILTTKSCLNIGIISKTTGTFTNTGEIYDNTSSGLSATDVQGAIDELENAISGTSGVANHAALLNLDYALAGHTGFAPALGLDDNYVTDAEKIKLGNLSGTNSGDVTVGTSGGLNLSGQIISLGTPDTLTSSTINQVTSTSHTHAISGFEKYSLYDELIVNGGMDVWQLGTSFTSATTPSNNDDTYLVDQWILLSDGNDIVDVTQSSGVTDIDGIYYAVKAEVETQNKKFGFFQIIESANSLRLAGKYVSLSFYAKTETSKIINNLRCAVLSWSSTADAPTSDVVNAWNASGADITPATNWIIENTPSNLALTTSWTKYTINNVYIDTASMTNIGLFIWVDDTDCAVDDLLYLTAVHLNEGSVDTGFKVKHITEIIKECNRYFEKSYALTTPPGTITNLGMRSVRLAKTEATLYAMQTYFSVKKLKTPVIKWYSPITGTIDNIYDYNGTADRSITSQDWENEASTGVPSVAGPPSDQYGLSAHWTADGRL